MYKSKYGKSKAGFFIRALIFVLFFTTGGITALFAERMSLIFPEPGETVYASEQAVTGTLKEGEEKAEDKDEVKEEVKIVPEEREVRLSGIEIGNIVSEGDVIDVRIVKNDGRDEKLLAGKVISAIENDGIFLIVKEEELSNITKAFLDMEDGTVLRAYAVRIP